MADLQPKLTELFAAPEVHTGAVLAQFGIRLTTERPKPTDLERCVPRGVDLKG